MNIIRITEFQAAESKGEELFNFLKSLIPYISSSEGCLTCEVLRKKDDPNSFVALEKWVSTEAHKASIENYPKEKMQAALPLLGMPPKGSFYYA